MVEKGNKRTSSSSSSGAGNGNGASPATAAAAAAAAGCPAHAEKKSKPSTAAAAAGGCPHLAGSDYRKGRTDGPVRCTWCVLFVLRDWVVDCVGIGRGGKDGPPPAPGAPPTRREGMNTMRVYQPTT